MSANLNWYNRDTQAGRGGLIVLAPPLTDRANINHEPQPTEVRLQQPQEFNLLSQQSLQLEYDSSHVAAGVSEACYEALLVGPRSRGPLTSRRRSGPMSVMKSRPLGRHGGFAILAVVRLVLQDAEQHPDRTGGSPATDLS